MLRWVLCLSCNVKHASMRQFWASVCPCSSCQLQHATDPGSPVQQPELVTFRLAWSKQETQGCQEQGHTGEGGIALGVHGAGAVGAVVGGPPVAHGAAPQRPQQQREPVELCAGDEVQLVQLPRLDKEPG